jgi:hypothetical protein
MFASTLTLLWFSTPAFAGDKDKDGVSNKVDECKTEPEDADGFEDEDGCPDPDNDADGLLDGDDQCPNEAEDKDGFEDEDGCPDPDNDGDGVPDADDQCADELEDGADADGCPTVTAELLMTDGLAADMTTLTTLISSNMTGEGCNDAADGAKKWLDDHDIEQLHAVYQARIARAPDVDSGPVDGILSAQYGVWGPAKAAMDVYCEKHVLWPKVSGELDLVYGKLKPAE